MRDGKTGQSPDGVSRGYSIKVRESRNKRYKKATCPFGQVADEVVQLFETLETRKGWRETFPASFLYLQRHKHYYSLKPEQHTLDQLRPFLHLLQFQIDAPDPVYRLSVLPRMFFRPEEDRFLSKRVDDALFFEIK
jgi:hypothetical protein